MGDPLFSVILPTCDRPASLLACLAGLARMRYPAGSFEVLVVHDGGAFPAESALQQAAAGLRLRALHQERQGPAVARNTGAAQASGTYLAFIDDDCVPHPDWLDALEARLRRDPGALIGGRTVNALGAEACSDASQLMVDFLTEYHDASAPGRTRFFATSNMAVSAEGFHRLGGFDAQFSYAGGEDRDFCDRWHASGGRSAFEPEAVVYHRHRLTMQGYLAQHFRYGRGALRFHRARVAREMMPLRTPARFYLDLVLYPLAHRPPLAAAARAGLLVAAQAATAAGYCWELASADSGRPRA